MKAQIRYKNNDLNEMFSQRLNYEKHKKKLEELTKRKSYYISGERINKLQLLKQRKHNSFIKDIQDRNRVINLDNLKIFQKLSFTHENKQQVTKLNELNNSNSNMNPFRKKMIWETELQNLRIHDKLKSLQKLHQLRAPSINNKKISEQYLKTKQIKNRISRYESSPGSKKILPKSQKFINFSLSQTARSNSSLKKTNQKNTNQIKMLKINQPKLFNQFYKKQQIFKNKIDENNRTYNIKRSIYLLNQGMLYTSNNTRPQTQSYNMRPNQKQKNIKIEKNDELLGAFFTTQMQKQQEAKTNVQAVEIQQEVQI